MYTASHIFSSYSNCRDKQYKGHCNCDRKAAKQICCIARHPFHYLKQINLMIAPFRRNTKCTLISNFSSMPISSWIRQTHSCGWCTACCWCVNPWANSPPCHSLDHSTAPLHLEAHVQLACSAWVWEGSGLSPWKWGKWGAISCAVWAQTDWVKKHATSISAGPP